METWMITGVTGFLGPRVEVTLREKGEVEVLPMTREELNFTDEEQVKRVLGTLHPDVLVHAAAVSDTGACERDPEGSWKVNVTGVEYLSKACRENGTKLIALPPFNGWSVVTAIIDGKVLSGYSSAKYILEV